MAELKPCKCGGLAFLESEIDTTIKGGIDFFWYCDECGYLFGGFNSKQQAIDAWNKRS